MADFVEKSVDPWTADKDYVAGLGDGEGEGACEFVGSDTDAAKGVAAEMLFAPKLLDKRLSVQCLLNAVLGVAFLADTLDNVFGADRETRAARTISVRDIKIAGGSLSGTAKAGRVIGGCFFRNGQVVPAKPTKPVRRRQQNA